MKKLKLFLTLLLVAAGANHAWAQKFTKGDQVTQPGQLSTSKVYFIEHTYKDGTSTSYGYMYLNGLKSGSTTLWNLNYNTTLPTEDNKFYVWRLVESTTSGQYYLQNVGNPECYILQTNSWNASYAGTGTKGDFRITQADATRLKFECTNGDGTFKYLGGMGSYGNNLSGVCGDDGDKHWERLYVANPDYSVCTDAQGNSTHGSRYTSQITFKMYDTSQTISTTQTAVRQPVYKDRTDVSFVVFKGAPIVSSHNMNGTWMHAYVYVDEDRNGFFVNEAEDIVNHVLQTGTNRDLKAFTYRNGYMSDGTSKSEAQASTIKTLPSFNAPNTTGEYRVRFMVEWNSTDPKGTNGSNGIAANGGLICDVTMNVADEYRITYVDTDGTAVSAKAVASSGLSAYNAAADVNRVAVNSTITGFVGAKDFLVRDFVSATINGTRYDSWDDVAAAVHADDNVVVTLTKPYLQPGKFFALKHAGNTSRYIYDTGSKLNAQEISPISDSHYIFTVEDAGDGKWYLRNAFTTNYVKRTGASGIIDNQEIPTVESSGADCKYYFTNALVPGRRDIYGIVDAAAVTDPTLNTGTQRYLHCNGNTANAEHKVVRWSTANTAGNNSQWYVEEVPVVNITFKDADGNNIDGLAFTATNSSRLLAGNKVLASVKGISLDNYTVTGYELDGKKFDTRTPFFNACHALTADGNAVLTLRPKAQGEVDVTIELWKSKGKGYANADMSDASPKSGDGWTDNLKVWALTVNEGDKDIKGSDIPTDIGFKITSSRDTGVGGMISAASDNINHYHYGHILTNPWCICFQDVSDDHSGTTFTMSVDEKYYILQYSLGGFPGANSNYPTLSNLNGGTVTLDNPDSNARQYNLTDTPAASQADFTVTSPGANNVAANYFRVRIVNRTYLENSMDRGYAICSDALNIGVGYPNTSTTQYRGLKDAIRDYDAEGGSTVDNYIAMLQAYSRYVSCTDLMMPGDCQVYTLSFIDNNATKVLVNNGDSGLELIEYNAANRALPGARWISHETEVVENQGTADERTVKKLVLVNKKDGKYLQALTATDGTGVSETYDAGTTSFTVRAVHQDMSDYMASATDEKLLGAVCMRANARPGSGTACKLTMANQSHKWATSSEAQYNEDYTSAMAIEAVDGGQTFSRVRFREAADGLFYATYYGFYPVEKPTDAQIYYVKSEEGDRLKLQPVQEDVIRPCFPVILVSDNELLYEDDEDGESTHLHIGEYTAAKKLHINELLEENANVLKGTLEDGIATSSEDGQVYVLSGDASGAGFFRYSGLTLPVGKAYYVRPAGSNSSGNIRGFRFDFNGVATQIDFQPEQAPGAAVYDLSGRRVTEARHGLYIVNGKKTVK